MNHSLSVIRARNMKTNKLQLWVGVYSRVCFVQVWNDIVSIWDWKLRHTVVSVLIVRTAEIAALPLIGMHLKLNFANFLTKDSQNINVCCAIFYQSDVQRNTRTTKTCVVPAVWRLQCHYTLSKGLKSLANRSIDWSINRSTSLPLRHVFGKHVYFGGVNHSLTQTDASRKKK